MRRSFPSAVAGVRSDVPTGELRRALTTRPSTRSAPTPATPNSTPPGVAHSGFGNPHRHDGTLQPHVVAAIRGVGATRRGAQRIVHAGQSSRRGASRARVYDPSVSKTAIRAVSAEQCGRTVRDKALYHGARTIMGEYGSGGPLGLQNRRGLFTGTGRFDSYTLPPIAVPSDSAAPANALATAPGSLMPMRRCVRSGLRRPGALRRRSGGAGRRWVGGRGCGRSGLRARTLASR